MTADDDAGGKIGGRQADPRWLLVAFAAAALFFSSSAVVNHFRDSPKDYEKWRKIGQTVLQGGELYPGGESARHLPYMYPPLFAVLVAPLAAMGRLTLIVVLVLLYTAAWGACILLSVYLATGKARGRHWSLYALPTLVCIAYLSDAYLLGQPNVLLLACLLGAFAALRGGRQWTAGGLIAFAAAVKAFPILAVGYLLWRRYWTAAVASGVFLLVLLILVPAPVRGLRRSVTDLRTWTMAMAFRYDEHGIAQRRERGNSWKNQSLLAVANRLLRPVDADRRDKRTLYVNVANLPFGAVNAVAAGAALALCLLFVTSMPSPRARTPLTDAIETAMLTLLILVFSPLSFIYSYVWLIYPLTVAWRLCLDNRGSFTGRWVSGWLAAVVALLALSIVSDTARAAGNTFWACVLLLLGFAGYLHSLRRSAAVRVETVPADDQRRAQRLAN